MLDADTGVDEEGGVDELLLAVEDDGTEDDSLADDEVSDDELEDGSDDEVVGVGEPAMVVTTS